MRRLLCLGVALAFLSGVLPGCAGVDQTARDNPKTTIGAGAGVLGGAVVGGFIGGKRGALIGGLLGGLAGGAVGHYLDQQEKDRLQTSRDYRYSPAQGAQIRIETVRVNPAALSPGETVNINLTYAVLTPTADTQVLVRETREILLNGNSVGKTSIDVSREGGTWKSTVPITLPVNAGPGKYRVIASIDSRTAGTDRQETSFQVTP
ncbi:MAG: glycine zipper domain-containing protein [Candidatus Deferrimicrobiaceae bacterium]